jgi:hypothetical protein
MPFRREKQRVAEMHIVSYEDATFSHRVRQNFIVRFPCEPGFLYGKHIMAVSTERLNRYAVNALISQEFHTATASSAK